MVFSSLKNKLLICLCFIVIIFPFILISNVVYGEYSEIEPTVINNLVVRDDSSSFISQSNRNLYYVAMEKNHKYLINFNAEFLTAGEVYIRIVNCSTVPAEGVNYDILYSTKLTVNNNNSSFEYYNYSDNSFIVLSPSGAVPTTDITPYMSFSVDNINGQVSAVEGLVNNVGINNLWNIFDISINYIVVVVLFAFGCYIIFRIIKKVSRGKEGL